MTGMLLLAATIGCQLNATAQSSSSMISDGLLNGPFKNANGTQTDPLLINNPAYLAPTKSNNNGRSNSMQNTPRLPSNGKIVGRQGGVYGRPVNNNQYINQLNKEDKLNRLGPTGHVTNHGILYPPPAAGNPYDTTYGGVLGCGSGIPQGYTTNYNPYYDGAPSIYYPTLQTPYGCNNSVAVYSCSPTPGGFNTNYATGCVRQGTNILPFPTNSTSPNNPLGQPYSYTGGSGTTGGTMGCNGYNNNNNNYTPNYGGSPGNPCGNGQQQQQQQQQGCNATFQATIGGPNGLNGDTNTINAAQNNANCSGALSGGCQNSCTNSNNGQNQGGDVPNYGSTGVSGNGGPSGNPLTPEQYNPNGPPTRPSGVLINQGSAQGCSQGCQQPTMMNGQSTQGTDPLQTIVPH
jgi:hypothetical protein